LIHFSSIDAIEQKPIHTPVNEKSPPAHSKKYPPYDRSKASGEAAVKAAIERGLDAVIVNPTAIIGPYDFQPSLQGQMLLSMARGSLPTLIQGGFDWVDVATWFSALCRLKNQRYAVPGTFWEVTGLHCPK
jgi:dihydroflavonol-4-reductase